ncbi:MAG TPA: DUF2971 domain-containing protein [Candidatus Acidoferrales bacterium]|nr:DUF2971 domain-containing protein [Candidatus Acidoferrales bacterium]
MAKRFGMICFSKRWSNPLLWSHYADKHRGICLGFDVDDRGLKPISYASRRPRLKIPPTIEDMDRLLFTKFQDWQYEEEWRNWFRLDQREGDHYFYPFDGLVQLREVIVGPLCDTLRADIDERLTGYSDHIRTIKARLAFKTFQVVKNRMAFRHY